MLLQVRDEFLHDGVPIGAYVRGVDRIGIVILRSGVLEGHRDHPGSLIRVPVVIELVPLGLFKPVGRPEGEMALDVVHGVLPARLLGIAPGQEDRRSKEHGLAPELREDVTLELDPLHPLGVLRDSNRRDHVPADQLDGLILGRVDMHPFGRRCRDSPANGSTSAPPTDPGASRAYARRSV